MNRIAMNLSRSEDKKTQTTQFLMLMHHVDRHRCRHLRRREMRE